MVIRRGGWATPWCQTWKIPATPWPSHLCTQLIQIMSLRGTLEHIQQKKAGRYPGPPISEGNRCFWANPARWKTAFVSCCGESQWSSQACSAVFQWKDGVQVHLCHNLGWCAMAIFPFKTLACLAVFDWFYPPEACSRNACNPQILSSSRQSGSKGGLGHGTCPLKAKGHFFGILGLSKHWHFLMYCLHIFVTFAKKISREKREIYLQKKFSVYVICLCACW